MENSVNVETIASVRLSENEGQLLRKGPPLVLVSSIGQTILFHKPWRLGN